MYKKALYNLILGPIVAGCVGLSAAAADEQPIAAKYQFGFRSAPAPLEARAIGSYAKGCLAGAQSIAVDGRYWQVMRLSRNRNWGHPSLVKYLKRLAEDTGQSGEWSGLLVGDLAQPRGGPMLSGHASHQIGLDADIWLNEMPDRRLSYRQREEISAISVVDFNRKRVNRRVWSDRHVALLKRAASYPEVARIFVNPIIKKELCAIAGQDRAWLRKIRPWLGHHYHMHVRLNCPQNSRRCRNQTRPVPGDGCGDDLARWFRPPAQTTGPKKPPKPKPPLTLASLPKSCSAVLDVATIAPIAFPPKSTPLPRKKP